jgi:hypothetical protein
MNENQATPSGSSPRRQPWNKGKLIGARPPLRASHVWSIRTRAISGQSRACHELCCCPSIERRKRLYIVQGLFLFQRDGEY